MIMMWAFGSAVFGGIALELLHWYGLHRRLHTLPENIREGAFTWAYWLVTAAVIIAGGVFALIWFQGQLDETFRYMDPTLVGAAFPQLFKATVQSIIPNEQPTPPVEKSVRVGNTTGIVIGAKSTGPATRKKKGSGFRAWLA